MDLDNNTVTFVNWSRVRPVFLAFLANSNASVTRLSANKA